jgi:nitroreductase
MHRIFSVFFGITVLAAFSACAGNKKLVQKNTDLTFELSADLKEALYYASLAPNGHNTQMWKAGVSPDQKTIRIYIDSSRLLPAVDPEGRESLISAGAFLENLRQALDAFGFRFTVKIAGDVRIGENPLAAEITITGKSGDSVNRAALARMEQRHTEKRKFLPQPLDPAAVSAVLAAAQNRALFFPRGSKEFGFIREQTLAANEIQAASPAAREELALWLRFSDNEAAEKADGLPAEQLGLKGLVKILYYAVTDREKAASAQFGKTAVKLVRRNLDHCEGFFIITGENSAGDYITTGMAMEALWLKAAETGIALQPLSQALEEAVVRDRINAEFPGLPFQMIIRAGYVRDYGENNKIRRPLQEFVFMEK